MELSLKTGRLTCMHCDERLYQLRAEMNSKIFVRRGAGMTKGIKNSSKQETNRRKQPRHQMIRENGADPMEDVEVPDDMEKAMDGEVIEMDDEQNEEDNEKDKQLNKESEMILKDERLPGDQIYLTPVEVQKHLRLLAQNERETLMHLLGKNENDNVSDENIIEMFFFECVAVPPSRFRPISTLKDQKFENARTTQLSKLIQDNMALKESLAEILKESDASVDAESRKAQSQAAIDNISSKLRAFLIEYIELNKLNYLKLIKKKLRKRNRPQTR